MIDFPQNASFTDAQKWVEDMCKERGFDTNTPLEKFLLFSEEVGELAKAIRKVQGMHVEGSHTLEQINFGIREEIADVAMYLMDIANTFSVNIEDAIREKEEINRKRTWK
ncbi:MAG: MazG nucleotide pyrophosphohydrolase domain-containing protein [Patescibacteria group bacterium]